MERVVSKYDISLHIVDDSNGNYSVYSVLFVPAVLSVPHAQSLPSIIVASRALHLLPANNKSVLQ